MKIEITVDSSISVNELLKAQEDSERLGGGFDIVFNNDNTAVITWDFEPKDPVGFIKLVDELQVKNSMDVMNNCEFLCIDDIAYHQSLDMFSIGDNLHIPNSLD